MLFRSPTREEWEVIVRRTGSMDSIISAAGRKPTAVEGNNVIFGGFYDDEAAVRFARKMTNAGFIASTGPHRIAAENPFTIYLGGTERVTVERIGQGNWIVRHSNGSIIARGKSRADAIRHAQRLYQLGAAENPLNVNHSYRRHKALQRDLTRYYESCIKSHSSHRFHGPRQKDYCARVAWTIAKRKYPDYKHAGENPMFETVGNLVRDTVSGVQDFAENPMGTPEKAAIAIGGGVAIAAAIAYFWMKNANAAPAGPPSVLTGTSLLQNPGAAPGSRVYAATVANTGQTVAMAVGDTLNVVLPNTANSGFDWLSPYAGTASGVNSPYPGLNRTNPTPGAYIMGTDSSGNITETDSYKAASTNSGTVQMLYLLLPVGSKGVNPDANGRPQSFVDANGNPITPSATFTLNYTIT